MHTKDEIVFRKFMDTTGIVQYFQQLVLSITQLKLLELVHRMFYAAQRRFGKMLMNYANKYEKPENLLSTLQTLFGVPRWIASDTQKA